MSDHANDPNWQFLAMRLILDGQHGGVTSSDAPLICFPAPDDPTASESLRLVEESGVLDFWADEPDDAYTLSDGEPV